MLAGFGPLAASVLGLRAGRWTRLLLFPCMRAAMAAGQQAWLNAIYDAVRSAAQGYYEDSVTLQCLLIMTGNHWDPVQ